MKIKAFGKLVSREDAYRMIINDVIADFVYAGNSDSLEEMLICGWKSLDKWTNQELEDHISELLIENQPNGKI